MVKDGGDEGRSHDIFCLVDLLNGLQDFNANVNGLQDFDEIVKDFTEKKGKGGSRHRCCCMLRSLLP